MRAAASAMCSGSGRATSGSSCSSSTTTTTTTTALRSSACASSKRGGLRNHHHRAARSRRASLACSAHRVEVEHQGKMHTLEVPDGENVLDVALANGIELPHDCKLGVCMTCPAKMVSGSVDQSGAMISEDVAAKGYALLCVAQPTSDCKFQTIPEEELLELQLN